ncbi:hypothetical protein PAPYR_3981 [Paratrimastix pyriformis]|uniref:U1-C C2H2-type zinc finger domain-containing protein n=1 Tax=Paratrimastix pyriformis TaxID=342808 RepID=A0ABQ8UQD5_9EUKA|nr:hypothetical protein PAPYR_3981 [Paratrimastix pyriformis]
MPKYVPIAIIATFSLHTTPVCRFPERTGTLFFVIFLASVRKSHNNGWKHKANVRAYYQQFLPQNSLMGDMGMKAPPMSFAPNMPAPFPGALPVNPNSVSRGPSVLPPPMGPMGPMGGREGGPGGPPPMGPMGPMGFPPRFPPGMPFPPPGGMPPNFPPGTPPSDRETSLFLCKPS